MTTPTTRKMVMSALILVVTGALLVGCSSDSDAPVEPDPSPPSPTLKISDEDLGKALDKLVFHSASYSSADGGACFVRAVKKAGVSYKGQAHIVEAGDDDLIALAESMQPTNPDDAALLASATLRSALDKCVDEHSEKSDKDSKPPDKKGDTEKSDKKSKTKANLKPKYPLGKNETVTSSSQLTKGLVSMFSSYALNEEHKKIYKAAGECVSGVAFEAGFSQKTLRFLAGGAPIGVGAIADYLPNDNDKKTWRSKAFTTALTDCTASATSHEED